jgi:Cytochrome P460
MRAAWSIVALAFALVPAMDVGEQPASYWPSFSGKALVLPSHYTTWPVVGASLGMTYSGGPQDGPGSFHRVYMNPSALAHYQRNGSFPDGTTFVLEIREARQRTSILRGGFFEGRRVALEASVKDRSRYPAGWAYFDFDNGVRTTGSMFPDTQCHSCHVAHGEKDSVFVQFYPLLRAGE